ncbi:hypothetical protein EVAR_82363_1 [Eumeta japonica]|uniref:Uncharacterized protein n=1 Tax=Eumeta variegata TaxID=151549 RepID=A0A4C1UA61_EUMVA|nr:hypothetical protein EVAR_82363_1 [Eumeta japonica]
MRKPGHGKVRAHALSRGVSPCVTPPKQARVNNRPRRRWRYALVVNGGKRGRLTPTRRTADVRPRAPASRLYVSFETEFGARSECYTSYGLSSEICCARSAMNVEKSPDRQCGFKILTGRAGTGLILPHLYLLIRHMTQRTNERWLDSTATPLITPDLESGPGPRPSAALPATHTHDRRSGVVKHSFQNTTPSVLDTACLRWSIRNWSPTNWCARAAPPGLYVALSHFNHGTLEINISGELWTHRTRRTSYNYGRRRHRPALNETYNRYKLDTRHYRLRVCIHDAPVLALPRSRP